MRRLALVIAVALLVATPLAAAPPTVPTSLPYQGLLLDGLGAPRTGSVDLTLRIFDGVVGGTLVYKQSFPAVALADGVFTVQLGPTGDGTDAPANPLTTSLATALAGDAGATAPLRFLEVTVNAEGALARTQILASAYAVRASSAASADTAATATTAVTATNATQVGGLSSEYVTQLLTWLDADGGNPPNTDPLEGTADVDGDGRANFIDSDNDGDGLSDTAELAQGSHVNLVTPSVASATPASAHYLATTSVTVNGTGFQGPLAVSFGSQTPAASSVTATSFQVSVGPQSPGSVGVLVGNANGQSDFAGALFSFVQTVPHAIPLTAGGVSPSYHLAVRPGTTETTIAGHQQYGVGDAVGSVAAWPLASKGANGQIATAFTAAGAVAGVRCRDLGASCAVELLVDTDADDQLEDQTPIPIETASGASAALHFAALARDGADRWAAAYQRTGATTANVVAHDRNGDGDFLDANEVISPSAATSFGPVPGALALDASDRVAFAIGGPNVVLAWDRNGDGDYADTVGGNPESFTAVTGGGPFITCIGATFDSAGRLAVVYNVGGTALFLIRDLNADGDFSDAGESTPLLSGGGSYCDVGWRAGQPLTIAYLSGSGATLKLDKNDDGDFADAGETSAISGSAATGLRLRLAGGTNAVLGWVAQLAVGATN